MEATPAAAGADARSGAPRVWVLADDQRPGTATQALAVAEALDWPYLSVPLDYGPLARLPNALLGASLAGAGSSARAHIVPPWPEIVIAAGRRSAPIARAVKRRAAGRAGAPGPFLVQLMYPGPGGLDDFDLIAVPHHDRVLPRANLFFYTGAAHRMTEARLEAARAAWAPRWSELSRPLTGLLVGGATRRRPFTERMAEELGREVAAMTDRRGAVLVTTSRRTGAGPADALRRVLEEAGAAPALFHRWESAGENPFAGILACADSLVVTGDSVSMCAEACAAGTPVRIFAPPGFASARHMRMLRELYDLGFAAPLGGAEAPRPHPPLNPAADIAAEIRRRLAG